MTFNFVEKFYQAKESLIKEVKVEDKLKIHEQINVKDMKIIVKLAH